ncbi:alpha-ketoglutarate-dependent dioxygenase AlkB [Micromonospora sp. NPDC047730]|uniref:alpha-ketoglutarate-dependent dioxygenase AlkB n=1 Tax=Micromonospora sp. NPDC047730 TaxID=3364253 RepID=UPI003712AE4A
MAAPSGAASWPTRPARSTTTTGRTPRSAESAPASDGAGEAPARGGPPVSAATRYPPGSVIGWHRDAPAFGPTVVGLSLGAACRLRFQRGTGDDRRVYEVELAPRSAYVLAGAARTSWQHSIPPVPALRHSVTFRQLGGR